MLYQYIIYLYIISYLLNKKNNVYLCMWNLYRRNSLLYLFFKWNNKVILLQFYLQTHWDMSNGFFQVYARFIFPPFYLKRSISLEFIIHESYKISKRNFSLTFDLILLITEISLLSKKIKNVKLERSCF